MLAGPGEAEASHPPAQAKEPAALVGIKRHGCDEAFRHKAEVLIAVITELDLEKEEAREVLRACGVFGDSLEPLLSAVSALRHEALTPSALHTECGICYEVDASLSALRTCADHAAHVDCLLRACRVAISEQQAPCCPGQPGQPCASLLPRHLILDLLHAHGDAQSLRLYRQHELAKAQRALGFRPCRRPDCHSLVLVDDGTGADGGSIVQCWACGTQACPSCLDEPHLPITCLQRESAMQLLEPLTQAYDVALAAVKTAMLSPEQAAAQQQQEAADTPPVPGDEAEQAAAEEGGPKAPEEEAAVGATSEEVIVKTTKRCPACKANIEKDQGCFSVRCHCGYAFCWRCRRPTDINSGHSHLTCPGGGIQVEAFESAYAYAQARAASSGQGGGQQQAEQEEDEEASRAEFLRQAAEAAAQEEQVYDHTRDRSLHHLHDGRRQPAGQPQDFGHMCSGLVIRLRALLLGRNQQPNSGARRMVTVLSNELRQMRAMLRQGRDAELLQVLAEAQDLMAQVEQHEQTLQQAVPPVPPPTTSPPPVPLVSVQRRNYEAIDTVVRHLVTSAVARAGQGYEHLPQQVDELLALARPINGEVAGRLVSLWRISDAELEALTVDAQQRLCDAEPAALHNALARIVKLAEGNQLAGWSSLSDEYKRMRAVNCLRHVVSMRHQQGPDGEPEATSGLGLLRLLHTMGATYSHCPRGTLECVQAELALFRLEEMVRGWGQSRPVPSQSQQQGGMTEEYGRVWKRRKMGEEMVVYQSEMARHEREALGLKA